MSGIALLRNIDSQIVIYFFSITIMNVSTELTEFWELITKRDFGIGKSTERSFKFETIRRYRELQEGSAESEYVLFSHYSTWYRSELSICRRHLIRSRWRDLIKFWKNEDTIRYFTFNVNKVVENSYDSFTWLTQSTDYFWAMDIVKYKITK